ncbi:MAG: glutathione S-transferase family protein [Caulobacteraceae bacterium]
MIVYGSSFSPYVRKTLAFISEKGLETEVVAIAPNSEDAAFRAASPLGKIPGFRDGDFAISDSTAIITYLEAKHPTPEMLPSEPAERARTVWFEEFADTVLIACMAKVFFNRFVAPRFLNRAGDEAVAEKAHKEELPPLLDYLESVVPASGHLVADRLTLADLAIASPFVNLAHVGIEANATSHPRLAGFLAAVHARPSFAPLIASEKAFAGR